MDSGALSASATRTGESTPANSTAGLTTWCEIDGAALMGNVRALRACLPAETALGIVVKSDAYGHGFDRCAATAVAAGADWLIVNTAGEAQRLRHGGLADVATLVAGPVSPDQAAAIAGCGADVVVYHEDMLAALAAAATAQTPVGVHLKVETGTHRQGIDPHRLVALARRASAPSGLRLRGICTHFADVEDGQDHRFARQQWGRLVAARQKLRHAGIEVPLTHAASSAAALLLGETRGDLVRVGIAAYGHWPSPETDALARGQGIELDLAPVLSWRARLAQVQSVAPGESVGYGRSWRVGDGAAPRRIAVLPVGYFEGLPRSRSNAGHVLVRGIAAPVRGRVCMNMSMVDVTDVEARTGSPVRAGEVATLIGRDGEGEVTAAQFADWAGTLHYEILARLHPAIPRLDTVPGLGRVPRLGSAPRPDTRMESP